MRKLLILLLALLPLAASAQAPVPTPAPKPNPHVLLTTSIGTIEVEVFADKAPVSARNFLAYVDQKRLDGVPFYRVVKIDEGYGFVQFGNQLTPARMLPPIKHEPTTQTGLSHTDGTLTLARLAPGTARGEFFFCVGDQTSFDANPAASGDNQGYAAFARLVAGRDVLLKILDTPVSPTRTIQGGFKGQMPDAPVKIVTARRLMAR